MISPSQGCRGRQVGKSHVWRTIFCGPRMGDFFLMTKQWSSPTFSVDLLVQEESSMRELESPWGYASACIPAGSKFRFGTAGRRNSKAQKSPRPGDRAQNDTPNLMTEWSIYFSSSILLIFLALDFGISPDMSNISKNAVALLSILLRRQRTFIAV